MRRVIMNDAAEAWSIGFQEGGASVMRGVVELYNNVMYYVTIMLVIVVWMMWLGRVDINGIKEGEEGKKIGYRGLSDILFSLLILWILFIYSKGEDFIMEIYLLLKKQELGLDLMQGWMWGWVIPKGIIEHSKKLKEGSYKRLLTYYNYLLNGGGFWIIGLTVLILSIPSEWDSWGWGILGILKEILWCSSIYCLLKCEKISKLFRLTMTSLSCLFIISIITNTLIYIECYTRPILWGWTMGLVALFWLYELTETIRKGWIKEGSVYPEGFIGIMKRLDNQYVFWFIFMPMFIIKADMSILNYNDNCDLYLMLLIGICMVSILNYITGILHVSYMTMKTGYSNTRKEWFTLGKEGLRELWLLYLIILSMSVIDGNLGNYGIWGWKLRGTLLIIGLWFYFGKSIGAVLFISLWGNTLLELLIIDVSNNESIEDYSVMGWNRGRSKSASILDDIYNK